MSFLIGTARCLIRARHILAPIELRHTYAAYFSSGNELGRGVGKGGGSGGSIREAGGSMGKSQAAKEEEYFRLLEREQMAALQRRLKEEVEHHEEEIEHHLEAIRKHQASMNQLDQTGSKSSSGHGQKKH